MWLILYLLGVEKLSLNKKNSLVQTDDCQFDLKSVVSECLLPTAPIEAGKHRIMW